MEETKTQTPPQNKPSGVLTIDELKALNLFSPEPGGDVIPGCYSNASFDFTLGNDYFFPRLYQNALEQEAKKQNINTHELKKGDRDRILAEQISHCTDSDGELEIPKFTSVVITTYESVNLPDYVAGRFDLRIRWALAGLILQVGTQIEPGYSGRLWGLLHNFSNENVRIKYHDAVDRVLTAEFYTTVQNKPPTAGKENKPKTLLEMLQKYRIKGGSLQNYFDEFDAIQQKFKANILEELDNLKRFRETAELRIDTEIDRKTDDIRQIRNETDVLSTRVQTAVDRVNDSRNNRLSYTILIGTFLISITLPVLVNKLTFDKDDFMMFDHTKELKEEIKQLRFTVDSLRANKNKPEEGEQKGKKPDSAKFKKTGQ